MCRKVLLILTITALILGDLVIPLNAAVTKTIDNVDVAISISADKTCYGEGQTINYEINYINRLDVPVKESTIRAQIPENTTIVGSSGDYLGNYIKEGDEVMWILDTINAFSSGRIIYQVKVNQLAQAETIVSNRARILAGNAVNGEDDQSTVSVLLFSNRFQKMQHSGYIKGYEDNTFRPSRQVTRAEASTILARVLNLKATDLSKELFKDIPRKHWAFEYITAVKDAGIFTGYSDKTFRPDDALTREELAVAIYRALKLPDAAPVKFHFSDITNDTWSKNCLEQVYRLKIINGYVDGTFKPDVKVTRAEMVAIINRMLYRGPLCNAVLPYKDLPSSHWAYSNIAEATIGHLYSRKPDGGELLYVR